MSPLTLLTATVVVLGLRCWVPTGAVYNARMANTCDQAAMSVVSSLNFDDFQGRWYQTHVSVPENAPFPYNAIALDVYKTAPLPFDRTGKQNAEFVVWGSAWAEPSDTNCSKGLWLTEVIDDYFSGPYQPWYNGETSGYYIWWQNAYVLATDYTSTAVMLSQYNLNGYTDITFAQIKVCVRDPANPPDAAVVDAALNGFCQGDALDLSSDFYAQVPNDSDLTCFAPPAK